MNAQTKIETVTLASAYALAFAEIEGATKAKAGQVGQQRYKYADLGSVIDAIKPALIKHGLFYTQAPMPSQGGVTIATRLHHAGGEVLDLGELFVPANKNDAQAYGSALTYARRYALVTAFGVPTEDDDGNAAVAGGHIQKGAVSPPQQLALITDAQLGELELLLDQLNVPVAEVLKIGKLNSLPELEAERFDGVRDWINKRAKEINDARVPA